ncbi:hypothetical protein L843_0008 [Mycobacterium intracellulare MIN_061107_1834]|nr:hypothetical protein L843_0008 [Mycobacterium intracellulare MIN_061107_1834]
MQFTASELGLAGRPTQRVLAGLRAVDPDDNDRLRSGHHRAFLFGPANVANVDY